MSAVIQAHQRDIHKKNLSLSTIHNPLAINKLPTGLLGVYKEFVAKNSGTNIKSAMFALRCGFTS